MKKLLFTIIFATCSLTILAQNKFLSREEAREDIDSLFYTISEVHPDMFGKCEIEALMTKLDSVRQNMPDSIDVVSLYEAIAPIVALIGDGHTDIYCPTKAFYNNGLLRLPLTLEVNTENRGLTVEGSVDNCIPCGAEIVSINGVTAKEMLDKMSRYVSGEREAFRLSKIRIANFDPFFHLFYIADSYDVVYRLHGTKKTMEKTLQPVSRDVLRKRTVYDPGRKKDSEEDYSYQVMWDKNVAVMNFNSCNDREKMRAFADSMITDLNSQGMRNLIIDVRDNPGGNTDVCDELIRHFASKPFRQFDKLYFRATPTLARLNPDLADFSPGLNWIEMTDSDYVEPTEGDKHFKGRVYILTSNFTFSSAASFAWTCQQNHCATLIGEETGGLNICMGNTIDYTLPHSKMKCDISFMKLWEYNAKDNDVHGAIPDYAVPQADALVKAVKLVHSL